MVLNPFDANPLSPPALLDPAASLGRGQAGRSGLVPIYRTALPAQGQSAQLAGLQTGATISYYGWDGAAWINFGIAGIAGPHALLSATHTDTLVAGPVRGDLMYGNATPKWARFPVGLANSVLNADGTDFTWSTAPTVLSIGFQGADGLGHIQQLGTTRIGFRNAPAATAGHIEFTGTRLKFLTANAELYNSAGTRQMLFRANDVRFDQRIGINTNAALARRLDISVTETSSANGQGIFIGGTFTMSGSGGFIGLQASPTMDIGIQLSPEFAGLVFAGTLQGDNAAPGTMTEMNVVRAYANVGTTKDVLVQEFNFFKFFATGQASQLGSGSVVDYLRGIYFPDLFAVDPGGVITVRALIQMDAQTYAPVVGQNWGILQYGTLELNSLGAFTLIGQGGTAPATSAALELLTTTGALLLSRMTTAQQNALTPLAGMVLYNTSTATYRVYDLASTSWVDLFTGAAGGHALLSASHSDTIASAKATGDIIYGAAGGWDNLAIAVPGTGVLRNVLGVDNGNTVPSWKALLDATDPADVAPTLAAPGTSLLAAHRDHVHKLPNESVFSQHLAPLTIIETCTGATSLTGTADTDITGCSVSVTPIIDSTAIVWATVDCTMDTLNDIVIIELDVDGGDQANQIIFEAAVASDRQLGSQVWLVNLAAGAHTLKLQGHQNADTAAIATINPTHTRLMVLVIGDAAVTIS
jgi:hypothetical protein